MNPRKIFPFFWVFFLYLAQNALGFLFPQRTPILLLCGVLFYSFLEGPEFGALLGAFAGLLLEVFGQGRFGSDVLIFSAAGFIFGRGNKTFFRESMFMRFLMPLLAFYFVVLIEILLFYLQLEDKQGFQIARQCFLPWDTLGIILAYPLIFFFLKKVSYGLSKS